MATTLARKAWRDLGRRRARAILTSATIALAVAGTGMLAVPTLIDHTMNVEVRETQMYDIALALRDIEFDDDTGRELAAIPNVDAVSARVTYSTRALIGDRRIPATVVGIDDFTGQSIDVVHVTSGATPADGQVLTDDGNGAAVDVSLDAGDRLRILAADGSVASPEVSGGARSLAFWQGPWDHPKHLVLYATNDTVRALSGVSGVNSLAFRLDDTEQGAEAATVTRLRAWLDTNVGPGALTGLPVTRDEGDWPGRRFAHQMTTFVYVLAGLALITAVFLIANTMNTLMAEQTAEIGVMKAIGGRRRQIAGVFLRAALYLAGFGVAVGVPIGIALAHVIADFVTNNVLGVPGRFAVSIPVVAFSVAFAVVLTVGASAPALWRALRIPVREALHNQGAAVTFGGSPIDRLVLHGRLLPRTIRFGARNLVRNKRRTAATTLQISLAVATALGVPQHGDVVRAVPREGLLDHRLGCEHVRSRRLAAARCRGPRDRRRNRSRRAGRTGPRPHDRVRRRDVPSVRADGHAALPPRPARRSLVRRRRGAPGHAGGRRRAERGAREQPRTR